MSFKLAGIAGHIWQMLLDTREEGGFLKEPRSHAAGEEIEVLDRSVCLLRLENRGESARPSRARRRAT